MKKISANLEGNKRIKINTEVLRKIRKQHKNGIFKGRNNKKVLVLREIGFHQMSDGRE